MNQELEEVFYDNFYNKYSMGVFFHSSIQFNNKPY